jgi:hypothetical protein
VSNYPYATGDLIEKPNTYFYSQFGGAAFIAAWRASRARAGDPLPKPVPPLPANKAKPGTGEGTGQSVALLEQALAGDGELAEAFVKKFEIHKRVHDGYGPGFRALDRRARNDLTLYLRAADLFAALYDDGHALRHLNVYLKCLDTICAMSSRLTADLSARLAWHVGHEREAVDALMAKRGIAL